jgi:hypothetical protein
MKTQAPSWLTGLATSPDDAHTMKQTEEDEEKGAASSEGLVRSQKQGNRTDRFRMDDNSIKK